MASFAGFGNLAAAVAGFFDITGWPDRAPAGPYMAYTDYTSPRFCVLSPSWPPSTTGAAPARASTSTSPRWRRPPTSSRRRCSTRQRGDTRSPAAGNVDRRALPPRGVPGGRRRSLGRGRVRNRRPVALPVHGDATARTWPTSARPSASPAATSSTRSWPRGRPARTRWASPTGSRPSGCLPTWWPRRPTSGPTPSSMRGACSTGRPIPPSAASSSTTLPTCCRAAGASTPGAGPTYGQHVEEVLGGILGYDGERIAELAIAEALE